jgi:hypothetical protein
MTIRSGSMKRGRRKRKSRNRIKGDRLDRLDRLGAFLTEERREEESPVLVVVDQGR